MKVEKLENIKLYNADCLEVMKDIPDKFFELAITDPPYGININVSIGRRKGDKKSNYHKFAGGDSSIPDKEYFDELLRISNNQIIWGGNYMTEYLKPSPCWILWDKLFSEYVTFAQFEMAWTSFKSSCKKIEINPNQINKIHPTQKPVQLYKWLLQKYAKEGDKILDTHFGSLSIGIACHDLHFELTASELDKEYYELGKNRLMWHQKQLNLF